MVFIDLDDFERVNVTPGIEVAMRFSTAPSAGFVRQCKPHAAPLRLTEHRTKEAHRSRFDAGNIHEICLV
jgi:hypothetical protein